MNSNKTSRNNKFKYISLSNKRRFTKVKIEENCKQNQRNNIKSSISLKKSFNKNKNQNNYYRRLLSENFGNISIMKKIKDSKDESNYNCLTTEYLEINNKLIDEGDKLDDYERLIFGLDYKTVEHNNISNSKKNNLKEKKDINHKENNKIGDNNDKSINEILFLKKENEKLKKILNEMKNNIEKIKNEQLKSNSMEKEKILQLNNENEKISLKLKNIFEENNQKNNIIQKLNNCILEYNKTIIESKNELSQRDAQIEKLIKEKNDLIHENDKLLNQIIQNKNESINLNTQIQKLFNESEIKNNHITSLTSLLQNIQSEKQIFQLINQKDSKTITSIILTYKQRQLELNNHLLILSKYNSEKDKIINNLNQNIIFYKTKCQENQQKIQTFIENLKDLKKYVNEVENMLLSKKLNELNLNTKNDITKKMEHKGFNVQHLNNDNFEKKYIDYNNDLLNSLRNMILNIDTKIKDNI